MNIITTEFNGTPVQVIDQDGHKWLTAEEAGRCLGYDESNARKGIVKLYERHADEFLDDDSRVVKLTSRDGKPRPSRIFSGTGCIKLGFFANTPRAKDFRTWASQALAGRVAHAPVADSAAAQMALAREIGSLRDQVQAQNGVILHLYNRLDGAQRGHIRAVTSMLNLQKRNAAREAKEMVIALEQQGLPRAEIAARTGKTLNHIRQIVHQARLAGRLTQQGELDL